MWVTTRGLRCGRHVLTFTLLIASSLLQAAQLSVYRADSMVGSVQYAIAQQHETLLDIGRRHNVGYNEITRANPDVDIWLPGAGTRVLIPQLFVLPDTPWQGITLNLAERRLYYFPPGDTDAASGRPVLTFPVGIGREGWQTPVSMSRVIRKTARPSWTPPPSIREEALQQGIDLPAVFPPGPDNPLGEYALSLSLPRYLLHGTNKPDGVGMRVSHGCIRLYPEDIQLLFELIEVDTPVWIIDQPDKAGWKGGFLYLESHPAAYDESIENADQYRDEIWRVLGDEAVEINWPLAEQVHRRADGVPTVIGRRL